MWQEPTGRYRVKAKASALVAVVVSGLCAMLPPAFAQAQPADVVDGFEGSALDPAWTMRDGYAVWHPDDPANHASYTVADGHLTVAVPGGQEHNMWVFTHAQLLRPYEGSGSYEIKLDSDLTGDQQFGIAFESAPNTFMLFMLYAHGTVNGYVERFHQLDGWVRRDTVVRYNSGLALPQPGPYHLRVTVDDDGDPTQRTWTFEWSLDGSVWHVVVDGALEEADEARNVGEIQSVALFAGNHPSTFSAFDARFDHFSFTPGARVPLDPPTVSAHVAPQSVSLSWDEEVETDEYVIQRATSPAGPFVPLATVDAPQFADVGLQDGTTYYYVVAVQRDGEVERVLQPGGGDAAG